MKHIGNIDLTEPHMRVKRKEVLIEHLDLFNSNFSIIISNHRALEY